MWEGATLPCSGRSHFNGLAIFPPFARRVAFLIAAAGAVLPAAAQDSDLKGDIDALQEQIDEAAAESGPASDPARAASRARIEASLKAADQALQSGDVAGAEAHLSAALAAVRPDDPASRNRVMLALAALKIATGAFDEAEAMLAEISASRDRTPKQTERLERLKQKLADARVRAVRQADAARRAEVDAEVASLATLPTDAALSRLAEMYAAQPNEPKIANAYARRLTEARRWGEAEAVYTAALANAATPAERVAATQTSLGLADLYLKTNRQQDAARVLDGLAADHQATGAAPPPRLAELRSRVIAPGATRIYGALTVSGGYNSNVSQFTDELDDPEELTFLDEGSAFLGAAARVTYDSALGASGDLLRVRAMLDERAYTDVARVDRTKADASIAYVHGITGSTSVIEGGLGVEARLGDYALYRTSYYGYAAYGADVGAATRFIGTLRFEFNDDENEGRDGMAGEVEFDLRHDLSDTDRVRGVLTLRAEDADLAEESRALAALNFVYRHNFFSREEAAGYYASAAYSPAFVQYDGPVTSGLEAGITREDVTQKLTGSVGYDAGTWRTQVDLIYTDRQSTLDSKDSESTQIMLSLTRPFGE